MENNARKFWDWFARNEAKYFFLNQIEDEDEREEFLDELLVELHKYCENLYFEVGGIPNEKQDLIISAEGNPDYYDKVEALVSAVPSLRHWNVIAFKPAREAGIIEHNNAKVDPDTSYFFPLSSNKTDKLGVRVYVENYDPRYHDDFISALYWLLDNILGEKSNTKEIGYVDVADLSSYPDKDELIELTKLPKYIKWQNSRPKS